MAKAKKPVNEEVEQDVPSFNIYEIYETDTDSEEDGKWFELGESIRIKLRRLNSKKSLEVREKLEKPYRRTHRNGTIPDKVMLAIFIKQLAGGIIVDWEGITDREGNEIECNSEEAVKLLEALPNLTNEISNLSMNMENFRAEDVEEAEKN